MIGNYTQLRVIQSPSFIEVFLARPEQRNAFDGLMIEELRNCFSEISHSCADDSQLRAVLLRGEGKSFCGGADLAFMKGMVNLSHAENLREAEKLYEMFDTIRSCRLPVVSFVQGAAFGGGLGLLASSDMVFACRSAQFCFSEVKLGISPAVISAIILKRIPRGLVGPFMNFGMVFNVEEAQRVGLVHSIIEDTEVDTAVSAFKTAALQCGPRALRETKRLLSDIPELPEASARARGVSLIAQLRVSDEGQEGLKSFLEKRKPTWLLSSIDEVKK